MKHVQANCLPEKTTYNNKPVICAIDSYEHNKSSFDKDS